MRDSENQPISRKLTYWYPLAGQGHKSMSSQQDKGAGAKPKAGAGNKNEFNKNSGAGEEAPRMTKAQLLGMLQGRLPKPGTGNEFVTNDKERMIPTDKQKKLMREVDSKHMSVIDGPFGTGKTIWTCYMGLKGLAEGKFNGIVVNAPAVEADEKLGFLPGTQDEKMLPHVLQIMEAIDDWVGEDMRRDMCKLGLIKIEPHAFMRGRTFKNKFCIFDEAQNATGKNLKTAISRYGMGSTFVFMGDDSQNDRTNSQSAYVTMIERFAKNPVYKDDFGYVKFDASDCKRHPLLKKMIENGDDHAFDECIANAASQQSGHKRTNTVNPSVVAQPRGTSPS